MPSYDAYVHVDVLDALARTGGHRRRILDFISTLQEHPNTLGNHTDQSDPSRDRQVKIVQGYALTYWPDHAAKTVMIVGLKPANE